MVACSCLLRILQLQHGGAYSLPTAGPDLVCAYAAFHHVVLLTLECVDFKAFPLLFSGQQAL